MPKPSKSFLMILLQRKISNYFLKARNHKKAGNPKFEQVQPGEARGLNDLMPIYCTLLSLRSKFELSYIKEAFMEVEDDYWRNWGDR